MEYSYKGKFVKVALKEFVLADGKKTNYEVVIKSQAVGVLVIKDNQVYLVSQYRVPFEEKVLEIPAGLIENNEEPMSAALRELKEETGLIGNNLLYLGEFYSSCGFTDEKIHLYSCEEFSTGATSFDEFEEIELVKVNLDDFKKMILSNEIKDSKTIIAGLKYFQKKAL